MKITKAKLKQIIKEEFSRVLIEGKKDLRLAIQGYLDREMEIPDDPMIAAPTPAKSREQLLSRMIPFLHKYYVGDAIDQTERLTKIIDQELAKRRIFKRFEK